MTGLPIRDSTGRWFRILQLLLPFIGMMVIGDYLHTDASLYSPLSNGTESRMYVVAFAAM